MYNLAYQKLKGINRTVVHDAPRIAIRRNYLYGIGPNMESYTPKLKISSIFTFQIIMQ